MLSFRSRYQKLKFFYELKKEAEEKSTNQFLVKARFSDSVEPEFAQLAKDFFFLKNKVCLKLLLLIYSKKGEWELQTDAG